MKSWSMPGVPELPGTGPLPRIWDTAREALYELAPVDGVAQLYVCGVTPYDTTHLGHAQTYLAFDTVVRLLRDAGAEVRYVQNVTDVDDPLLERADALGIDWRQLAADQIELFRTDQEALRIIPPTEYVGVVESVHRIANAVVRLYYGGYAYTVPGDGVTDDLYFDLGRAQEAGGTEELGSLSHYDRELMLRLSAERGGDPERPGKRDPLDPLLWRAQRPDEPSWPGPVGRGRPGWHIECSVIGLTHLTAPITLAGGGGDLVFPHHELTALTSEVIAGKPWADAHLHIGLVAYQGEKMSKSLGNLVLVSRLVAEGRDPRAIRLALLSQHHRAEWEWTDALLADAETRLARWSAWTADSEGTDETLLHELRTVLREDLDTAGALRLIDEEAASGRTASRVTVEAIDALLGIRLPD